MINMLYNHDFVIYMETAHGDMNKITLYIMDGELMEFF